MTTTMKSKMQPTMTAIAAALVTSLALAPSAFAQSSFNDVRNVLLDREARPGNRTEQEELDVYRRGALPRYEVSASNFVVNGVDKLLERAQKTVNDTDDFYPRLTKLLHPNGICFTGEWVITEPTAYTGYFGQGRRGLFVGRASVAMTETTRGNKRGFGFAGKIFPTTNATDAVATANFFTVDVLMGTERPGFIGTALTNEPETGFDVSLLWLGLKIAKTLTKADANPGFRPLYPIGELGLVSGGASQFPKWMKLETDESTRTVNAADFREELDIAKFHPNGIRLNIYASNTTKDRNATEGWEKIGHIQLKESFVSYGCDRQLHFAHPKLK